MKKKNLTYMRRIRTMAEKRANQDCEYVRPKRRPHALPSSWDERHCTQKTWKVKRRHQYRESPRGKKHSLFFKKLNWRQQWQLQEYFDEHDIPYYFEQHKKSVYKKVPVRKRVKDKYVPSFVYCPWGEGHQCGYHWTYKYVLTGEYETRKYFHHIGTTLTWWSDKDIGVKYILARIQQ